MISQQGIRTLRRALNALFVDRCNIYEPPSRTIRTSEGDVDDSIDNWSVTSNVRCRVRLPEQLKVVVSVNPPDNLAFPQIKFPAETTITQLSRIKITQSQFNPSLVGQWFDVVSCPPNSLNIQRIANVKWRENAT